MKAILIGLAMITAYVIWQFIELKRFEVTRYRIADKRIEKEYNAAVIADLHGFSYGKKNERLLDAVRKLAPDVILIPGDMIVGRERKTYEVSLDLMKELVKLAPVYYAMGNHESRVKLETSAYYDLFSAYQSAVEEAGVTILQNGHSCAVRRDIEIAGIEIPLVCYTKGKEIPLPENFLKENLNGAEEGCYQILLAHNPVYAKEYASAGADLSICGHNHGGLVRLPGGRSLISPQFKWFPKYDAGKFRIEERHAVVSRGLGTHTFHIRIFNRAELVSIQLEPQDIG